MKLTTKLTSLNEKRAAVRLGTVLTAALVMATTAFASNTSLNSVATPIVDLINSFMAPLLAIVGAIGTLYCVILGVKFAKAEEPQEREKAKTHLKNAIIGFVIIFVLILALNLLTPILANWVNSSSGKHIIDTNGL